VSDYQVSYAHNNPSFDTTTETNSSVATLPSPKLSASLPSGLIVLYYLHWRDGHSLSPNGLAVLSLDSLCPQFDGSPNINLFRGHFGIKFNCGNHHYVRDISPFEFAPCHGFTNNLWYCLLQPDHWFALDAGIPALTSAWIFDHVNDKLCEIQDSNTEIFPPRQFADRLRMFKPLSTAPLPRAFLIARYGLKPMTLTPTLCVFVTSSVILHRCLRTPSRIYHTIITPRCGKP
jgi:hypothetical protein